MYFGWNHGPRLLCAPDGYYMQSRSDGSGSWRLQPYEPVVLPIPIIGMTNVHTARIRRTLTQLHDINRADAELRAVAVVCGVLAFVAGLVGGMAI